MVSAVRRRGGNRWSLVLAGGEGSRLHSLTGRPGERPVPKQFCSLRGGPSLLRLAVERAARGVPRERVLVVVARQHRRWWRGELVGLPAENVVVQPENRGTAAGILLPLLTILRRDPSAEVAVLPSDHWVDAEWILQVALERSFLALRQLRAAAILLGMTPEGAESDLGWIEPQEGRGPVRGVASFREKPSAAEAAALWERGALVSSFLLVARARRLLRLYATHLPALTGAMLAIAGGTAPPTPSGYRRLPVADFSRDLLEPAVRALAVTSVPPCGWSDLGTPERVARCLARRSRSRPRTR